MPRPTDKLILVTVIPSSMKTKIKQLLIPQKLIAMALLAVLVLLGARGLTDAQAVAQGYQSDETLQRGMIVQIKSDETHKIESLGIESADKMFGVVVDPNDAPVTVAGEDASIFVATTGRYHVLVNTQNGTIEPGDYVTISALRGVGMRVDDKAPVVIGRALEGFDGQNSIGTAKIGEATVQIGRIKVDITVSRNPLQKQDDNIPEFLKRAAETIAGKPVDTLKVYVSLVIFLVGTTVAAVLMYSGVRSGIISIGRNPLSKTSIIRSMLQVVVVGLIIFITSVFGVYLLLKL